MRPRPVEFGSFFLAQALRPQALATLGGLAIGVLIAVNALYLQPGPHPSPFFPKPSRRAAAPAAPTTRAAMVPARKIVVPPPAQKIDVAPDPLVAAVQSALALSAYGRLTPDGVNGPATSDAIKHFQADHGLPVTGEISESLVVELRAAGAMHD